MRRSLSIERFVADHFPLPITPFNLKRGDQPDHTKRTKKKNKKDREKPKRSPCNETETLLLIYLVDLFISLYRQFDIIVISLTSFTTMFFCLQLP